jgi:hypothetical protein
MDGYKGIFNIDMLWRIKVYLFGTIFLGLAAFGLTTKESI